MRGTPFADAPIIPTSVVNGQGLEELKTTLASLAARSPEPRDIGKPRLPVDRVFQLQGVGTIVTGHFDGWPAAARRDVIVQPSGHPARIRNLQSHNRDVEFCEPGTRTAINLPSLVSGHEIRRGDVIALASYGGASKAIDAILEISSRATRVLKDSSRVWIHHGSGSVPAKIVLFSQKNLATSVNARSAQFDWNRSAFFFTGDRFVVRDWAGQHTLAGGTVLDADASTAHFHNEKRLEFLQQRANARDPRTIHYDRNWSVTEHAKLRNCCGNPGSVKKKLRTPW